ncbi:MAG: glycosyltransferase [Limisphaerales bacterium]
MSLAPRIAVLVHGRVDSIEAVRARGLAQQYPRERLHYLWRDQSRPRTCRLWQREIRKLSPDLLYVINTALPGALLACWWRWHHQLPFVLDTGDVVYEMAVRAGTASCWKRPWLRAVEALTQRLAHTIVVRGTGHREYLERQQYPRVQVIRDGFTPAPDCDLEAVARLKVKLGLASHFVVGVMGSLVYSPRLKICYGWDLIRALAHLRDLPVRGVIIGDGPGRKWLEEQAHAHGVSDRVVFCGRIAYADVPVYLRLMDVALSTQTNNLPGQIRTTGKLPEYMAAERFIIASRVGEAALLLPRAMLLDFEGEVDSGYPRRLADRVREIWQHPAVLETRHQLRAIVETNCSYPVLSAQFNKVVASVRSLAAGA